MAELITRLQETEPSDIESYPNKYCEVLGSFDYLYFEVPRTVDQLEFDDISIEVVNFIRKILQSKDSAFVEEIYISFRSENDWLFDQLWDDEIGECREIPLTKKIEYAAEYVFSNFQYNDNFDLDAEILEGYRELAMIPKDDLSKLVFDYLRSAKASESLKLPLNESVTQLAISSLNLSQLVLKGEHIRSANSAKALAKETQLRLLIVIEKLGLKLGDILSDE